jgi:hypothetical protein
VYDTLVFIAITWRLVRDGTHCGLNNNNNTRKKGGSSPWSFIFGKHLPAFSRSLLQDGQVYYLSTVGLAFMSVIFITIESIPAVYRSAIGIPNIMLINVMACRVFRNTKFGIFRETTTSDFVLPTTDLSIVFKSPSTSTQRSTVTSGEIAAETELKL